MVGPDWLDEMRKIMGGGGENFIAGPKTYFPLMFF